MFAIFKNFGKLLNKKQKSRLVILFIITLIGAFLEVIGVSLMLPLITAIMNPNIIYDNEIIVAICRIFDIHSHRTFAILCIGFVIITFIVKDLFLMLQYYIQVRFICNNQFAMQQRMLNGFLHRPYEFFLNTESGELLRVIQGDVSSTYVLLATVLSMCTEIIVAAAISATIFVIDPIMTIFVTVMLIVVVLIITKVVKPILKVKGLQRQKSGALANKWLLQSITGIKEIKVAGKENFFERNYALSGKKYISAEKWNTVMSNLPRLMIEMVSVCSMLFFIAFMIYNGADIEKLIPTLGAFAMAAMKLMPSANRVVSAMNQISFFEAALKKLIDDIEVFEGDEKRYEGRGMINITPVEKFEFKDKIEMLDISYSYPNSNKSVFEAANMTIPVGSSVGIVGISGAGKTTIVDILLGLLDISSGEILVDGVDVRSNYKEWLHNIGYIPQSIFMLDDTIKNNIAFGVPEELQDDEKVWKALEEAQLAEFVKTLENGINTKIGERGMRLSGGQRQRIGIARALYEAPGILVFDEATSALDNETEAAIMESINSLHGRKTMIIIAHRLQTIEGCDIVYRVEGGKISRER